MNFISNKDLYQRIGKLDYTRLKSSAVVKCNDFTRTNHGKNSFLSFYSSNSSSIPVNNTTFNFGNKSNIPEHRDQHKNTLVKTSDNSFVVVAITEGRGYAQGEVGIAALDLSAPALLLSQLSDEFLYQSCITKLKVLNPIEIILPTTIFNSDSKLVELLKLNFQGKKITPLPRRHFNVEEGLRLIRTHSAPKSCNSISFIEKKYYTLSAASGLLLYLKHIMGVTFLTSSLKIEYENRYGRMMIDYESGRRLELLYPLCITKEKRSCLYGILDRTVTAVGKRCLRARVLEPFSEESNIHAMQECIKELLDNPDSLVKIESCLRGFASVDKILKICVEVSEKNQVKSVELMLNQILLLKTILESIPELADVIRDLNSEIFRTTYKIFTDSNFSIMLIAINDIIRSEVKFVKGTGQHFQRIHAIRDGVSDFLDMIQNSYTKLTDTIRETVKELAKSHNLPLRMIYTIARGFHMHLTQPKNTPLENIHPSLNVLYRNGRNIYFTNSDIIKLNVRIQDVVNEIYTISDSIIRKLISNIIQYTESNHILVGAITNLDIIQSLSKMSLTNGYCCPEFGEETRVENATNPMLDFTRMRPVTIPNNIIATPEYNIFIITGPNMGGKTIYIKTIAILQIMAQLGCFVPATKATFRLCDRIFTRIGFEDDVEQNASSFQVEMREMENIFRNVTPNSLVLVDELCRSTNAIEGKELAWKLIEKLCFLMGRKKDTCALSKENETSLKDTSKIENTKLSNITSPFIYITTHFQSITSLSNLYFNVTNLHLAVEESLRNGDLCLKYTHKVMVGVTPLKGYGLSLARCIRFPSRIVPRAFEILSSIKLREENEPNKSRGTEFINEDFCNLERTLSTTINRESTTSITYIANFINSTANNRQTLNVSTIVTARELLKEIEYLLYDLSATILTAIRISEMSKTAANNTEICSSINEFIKNQPKEFITEILKGPSISNVIPKKRDVICMSLNHETEKINFKTRRIFSVTLPPRTTENSSDNQTCPSRATKLPSTELHRHNMSSSKEARDTETQSPFSFVNDSFGSNQIFSEPILRTQGLTPDSNQTPSDQTNLKDDIFIKSFF